MSVAIAICAVLSVLPFAVTPLPMMPDLFNHMARYYIVYADESVASRLAKYYEVKWALLGNLGMDLVVYPFTKLFGFWFGPILATALLPPLTIISLSVLSKAAWGRVVPTIFLALPFVYTFSFLFGFTNYHLSIAFAFLVTASWISVPHRSTARRWLIYAPAGLVVWLAHTGGWAVLVTLVGSSELVAVFQREKRLMRSVRRAIWTCLPLALPVVLTLLHRGPASDGSTDRIFDFHAKIIWIELVLASEWKPLDYASVVLLGAVGLYLLVAERNSLEPRLMAGALMIGVLFVLIPSHILGSYFADERLLPVAFMVFFISIAPKARNARLIAASVGLALFLSRLTMTSIGWHDRGMNAIADLAVLNSVPAESRIAVFGPASGCRAWPLSGQDELPSLAIMTRNIFVNTVWDQPLGQIVRPVYNRDRGYNDNVSSYEKAKYCPHRTADEFMRDLPRDRFDYLWTFSTAQFPFPWLKLVSTAPGGRLYEIRH